jgi:hypothetical protein
MNGRGFRLRALVAVVAACGALTAGTGVGAPQAAAADRVRLGAVQMIAPGIEYRTVEVSASHGTAFGHLLVADLRNRHVMVDLLSPGAVAADEPVSAMAATQGAVAGVNADFFDISETQHPGVPPTGAAVGPAIGHGSQLKAAVPDGQRFGPPLPPATSTRDVIGVGYDKVARLDRLSLAGSVATPYGSVTLGGFNQYALPVGGIGAYTAAWGQASRLRTVCGTDDDRAAPCDRDSYEVMVRHGRVVAESAVPGAGPIGRDTVVLVGRDEGARALARLRPGQRVAVRERLAAQDGAALHFAVGGFPILRGGAPLAALDAVTAATRTSAGIGSRGHRLYLLALDGTAENGSGLTVAELAGAMREIGATDAVNLDGGGSSTLVTRDPATGRVTVRNHPSGGTERPVPEGIGLFSVR